MSIHNFSGAPGTPLDSKWELAEPEVRYTCARCEWTGTNPCWTERNGEAVLGEDGKMHEPISHHPVCRLCYAPCRVEVVAGNNVITTATR